MESKRIEKILITKDDDIDIVYFVNENDENGSLTLQFQPDLSEQEIQLGWTKYYLGYADGSCGNYNCIDSLSIKNNEILFDLNSTGVRTFGTEQFYMKTISDISDNIIDFLIKKFSEENVTIDINKSES